MKDLKELIEVAFSKRIGKIETFNEEREEAQGTLFYKFYKGVLDGQIKTDEDAAHILYNKKKTDISYKVLKLRLKERLYNTIIFTEPRDKSAKSFHYNLYYCYKHYVISRLLLIINLRDAGKRLMSKVVNRAIPYQIFDIVLQAAITLRRQCMLEGDIEGFKYYNELFKSANEKVVAEATAEELYNEVAINFSKSVVYKPELVDTVRTYLNKVKRLKSKYNTFYLEYYNFNLNNIYCQLSREYSGALLACSEYEEYLTEHTAFYSQGRHAAILTNKMNCLLHLKQYKEGAKCAEEALQLFSGNGANWFVFQELHFRLMFSTRNLDKAVAIYAEVVNNPRFGQILPAQQETWKVFSGYLWFMLRYENKDKLLAALFKTETGFNISKLVNDIPIHQKDKKGYNVAVLILQVLILLEKRDFTKLIGRTDALKNYTYKNLQMDDAERSHYFIKMLLALENAQFEVPLAKRKTKGALEKLKAKAVNYSTTQTRLEILPYEELWDIILDMLEKKQARKDVFTIKLK